VAEKVDDEIRDKTGVDALTDLLLQTKPQQKAALTAWINAKRQANLDAVAAADAANAANKAALNQAATDLQNVASQL